MTMNVFLVRQNQWGSPTYNYFSEDGRGKWKDMQSVDNYKDADYLIYVNRPDFVVPFDASKIFCFTGEPDEFHFVKNMWKGMPEGAHFYKRPVNHWHSFIKYKDFKQMYFPSKTRDLSWVTTSQGDENTPEGIQKTEGQRLRMEFLETWLRNFPNQMYLYGRKLNKYFPMQSFEYCGGELTDLWDGVRDYRYNICFETSYQPGYFCKLYDAILAGCMPIYWGCPDLEKYLPKNSFIRISLRKDLYSTCLDIVDIVKSDVREQNLDELEAAKQLLLDKWNIWEVFYQEIKNGV